jgi:nitroimidazol reductase NimA-like FMN-containing flavoprotein (pyridoxamine 5'-phosphate oxidase superfamily)
MHAYTMRMSSETKDGRAVVRRHADRAHYDSQVVHSILDEALFCNLGIIRDGTPVVLPTIHARVGDTLYLHGSHRAESLRVLSDGLEACVSATLVDALVLGRSVFHHSLNYRSVVLFGRAVPVTDLDEKRAAFEAVSDHIVAGRRADVREPSKSELKATALLALQIETASAKIRSGMAGELDSDLERDCWAGLVPLAVTAGTPVPDEHVEPGTPVPDYLIGYRRD